LGYVKSQFTESDYIVADGTEVHQVACHAFAAPKQRKAKSKLNNE
jgi:hypothetical protein